MTILTFPNQSLRATCPEFDFANPVMDPVALEKLLVDNMLANNGIGLAANQIGIETRVFAMGHVKLPKLAQAFFNPMIIANTEDLVELEEGCLSFPNIYVTIKRPRKIRAKWQDRTGVWQESEFEDYQCRCFLHELDHLEGIVFQDRVSTLKWALAVKKTQKRKHK
jgi:peptide deformylase